MARSPAAIDAAVDEALAAVFGVFSNLHLEVNLNEGKTECFLTYRGRGAVRHREARRQADGKLKVAVPGRPGLFVGVVGVYKHLGTFCSPAGACYRNAAYRAQSAMEAYGPISLKVFGSELVPTAYKLAFLSSLVLSRLLFGVYVTVPTTKDIRVMSAVYMRALRRIGGRCRYDASSNITDLEVRRELGQPSLDCLIARRRLLYAGRLVRARPRARQFGRN